MLMLDLTLFVSSYLAGPCSSGSHIFINVTHARSSSPALPQSYPELRRVQWTLAVVEAGPNICEEIIHVPHDDTQDFVLRDAAMHEHVKRHQHPW